MAHSGPLYRTSGPKRQHTVVCLVTAEWTAATWVAAQENLAMLVAGAEESNVDTGPCLAAYLVEGAPARGVAPMAPSAAATSGVSPASIPFCCKR